MSRSKVLEIIKISVQKIEIGRPTYINSDEEALVVASEEIEGAHGFPIDVNTLGSELQLVIKQSIHDNKPKISQTINHPTIPT